MTTMSDRPQRRARRQVLTDKMIADLPRKAKPYLFSDPEMPRHAVRVMPDGPPHAYYVVMRDPYGKQRWKKIGATGAALPVEEAREKARSVIARIAEGLEPDEPVPVKKDLVTDVCAKYLKRHVEKKKIISAPAIRRMIDRYILPTLGDRVFVELKRSDVTRLLDRIEDVGLGNKKKTGGAKGSRSRMADQVLALLVAIGRWQRDRDDGDDDYTCPFAGMKRRVDKDGSTRTMGRDRISSAMTSCAPSGWLQRSSVQEARSSRSRSCPDNGAKKSARCGGATSRRTACGRSRENPIARNTPPPS